MTDPSVPVSTLPDSGPLPDERWIQRVKLLEKRAKAARAELEGRTTPRDRLTQVGLELIEHTRRISAKRKPFSSPHEVYGVLLEEVAEYFDEVLKKDHLRSDWRMRNELLDVAAVALRAAMELDESEHLESDDDPDVQTCPGCGDVCLTCGSTGEPLGACDHGVSPDRSCSECQQATQLEDP
jgi:NTP pyrophosphatase (non-canonical NTP hydrolase)